MAPPQSAAVLPVMLLSVIVGEEEMQRMAPPLVAFPPVMVKPEMASPMPMLSAITTASVPLPCSVVLSAPAP